jgi:glutaredoxin
MTKENELTDWYTIFVASGIDCKYCTTALDLLRVYGTNFHTKDISTDSFARKEFKSLGHRTVPQCYREGVLIGGSDKLQEHLRMTLIKVQEEKEIERKVKF